MTFKEDFYLIETIAWQYPAQKQKEQCPHGFLYGDMHLKRLRDSANFFGFHFPEDHIKGVLDHLSGRLFNMAQKGAYRYKVRCILHPDGQFEITDVDPINEIMAPVKTDISDKRVNPEDLFLYHKTSRRSLFDQERLRLEKAGLFETIFLNNRDELTQGTITNLFVDMGYGPLLTPALKSGLLPGILRQYLLKNGIACEATLKIEHLKKAHAIFLGNSVRGLLRAETV